MENKKLEIGGGLKNRKSEGYLQMDAKKLPGVDVVGDVNKLPFKDGELSEIYGHWILEHFAYRDVPNILKEWKRALKDGGLLHLITNNGQAHLEAYLEGVIDVHELNRMLFGVSLYSIPEEKRTSETPQHYWKINIEDLHKIFWTEELVHYFFDPLFSKVDVECTWKHREADGKFKCPGIIIKAWK